MSSSSSSAPKKVQNKKASTSRRGAAVPSQSLFRVVAASGVITSPGPNTIIGSSDLAFACSPKNHRIGNHSSNVHARFDLGVYIACTISNYLATVYSDEDRRYQLLHHQLYMSTADAVQGFHISAIDASIFVQSLFKNG